uniref:Putative mitotic checkpoint protein prcc n=1 Tax=Ornithodoros turicata TaxID=34597 RepID=A0A2R5LNN9_9ACAR
MSLVAYGDSSDEDATSDHVSGGSSNLGNLLAKLPSPADDCSLHGIAVRHSSKSKRTKILIPSLNDFGDDDEEESRSSSKKFKPSQTGSGLVQLLPAPQNSVLCSTQLMPHVLKKAATKSTSGRPTITQHDEDDDDIPSTFFSFSEPPQIPKNVEETSSIGDDDVQEETSKKGKIVWSEPNEPGTVAHDVMLDDGALVRLRGRRNEEIHIIDVSAADQMDKTQVLVKGLTEQQTYQSPKDNNDFHTTQMHRRKHQITYLAQQAKEREQELKNMWAQNRMTRKQTQAKYGF